MHKVLLIFLICSALAFVESRPERNMDWWNKGNAVIFKSQSFEDAVGKDKDIVVQFCAQFSADCHNIVPEYEKLVDLYATKNKDVIIGKLDGWTFNAIPQEYGIRNFPEIVLFRKGSKEIASKFEGEAPDRTAVKMSEWIDKVLSQPPGAEKTEQDIPQADTPKDIPQADTPQDIPQADAPKDIPQADAPKAAENVAEAPAVEKQQNQEPAKAAETQQQQTQTIQGGSEEDKKELKLVLNTTLLQDQFTDVNNRLDTFAQNINNQNAATAKSIDELKALITTQRQEIVGLQNTLKTFEAQKTELNNLLSYVKDHSSKIDSLSQTLAKNKNDVVSSIQEITQKSVDGVKSGFEKVHDKLSESKNVEPKESGMGGITMLLLGAAIGGAVGFVIAGLTGKKTKKGYLLD